MIAEIDPRVPRRAEGWLRSPAVRRTGLAAILFVIAFAGWMSATGRSSLEQLSVPVNYSGDAIGVLGHIKAYASGDILPWLPKEVDKLGAPTGANWTDYPNEDLLYFAAGMLARAAGFFTGVNLFLVLLQALAGIAFLAVGRSLGYRLSITFAGAVLFTLAPYAFERTLDHLSLAAYFHVPLALFTVLWTMGHAPGGPESRPRRQLALAATGAFLAGVLNPYYLAAFGWLMAWVFLGALLSRSRPVLGRSVLMLAIAAGAFTVQTLDSLWMFFTHGPNLEAFHRNLKGLDQFGLRLPDLAFPRTHRWEAFETWARSTYHAVAAGGGLERGEAMRAYIGLAGALALGGLLVAGSARLAARQFERISPWYWLALAVIAYGVVGGINYFLGAFGFVMLRGTNRFSIVLAAIALLWLCERASVWPRLVRWAVAVAMLTVGVWDQLPRSGVIVPPPEAIRPAVLRDAKFVAEMESTLPAGSMILQVPLKAYPESGFIHRMSDYDHLRPYLHSSRLRFSYGSLKGRGDTEWQLRLATQPPAQIVARAREYGFAAIMVNRNAYVDAARGLDGALRPLLGAPVATNDDYLLYRIADVPARPALPPMAPGLRYKGFSYVERGDGHAWSWAVAQDAEVTVRRPYRGLRNPPGTGPYAARFVLESFNGGAVSVRLDGREVASLRAGEGGKDVQIELPGGSGKWILEFHCDRPPISPANGDPRKLSFRIRNLEVREAGASAR